MIFKIQRPMFITDREMPCLIYNREQTIMHLLDMTPELRELFGDEYKFYIDSYIEKPTQETEKLALLVGVIVKGEDW